MISIDVEFLISNDITPNQFIIAYLISNNNKRILELLNIPTFDKDIQTLLDKEFLQPIENPIDVNNIYEPTRKLLRELFEADYFDEFYLTFPTAIKRTWGTYDNLKSNKAECRAVYTSLIDNINYKHKHILKCLKEELSVRQLNNSMCYMKNMSNWLLTKEWQKFEHTIIENNKNRQIHAYGCELE